MNEGSQIFARIIGLNGGDAHEPSNNRFVQLKSTKYV